MSVTPISEAVRTPHHSLTLLDFLCVAGVYYSLPVYLISTLYSGHITDANNGNCSHLVSCTVYRVSEYLPPTLMSRLSIMVFGSERHKNIPVYSMKQIVLR